MTTMTGRQESPLPPAGELTPLARRLRQFRRSAASPPYREMALMVNYSAPALSQAASGKKFPSWEVVAAYLSACQVTDENAIAETRILWETTKATRRSRKKGVKPGNRPTPAEAGNSTENTVAAVRLPEVDPRGLMDFDMFADALTRVRGDLTVRDLIERSQVEALSAAGTGTGKVVQLKKSTVYDVLNKKIKPSVEFTRIYLRACGMPDEKIAVWLTCLQKLHDDQRRVVTALKALTGNTHQIFDTGTPLTAMTGAVMAELEPAYPPETGDFPTTPPTGYQPQHRRSSRYPRQTTLEHPAIVSLEWHGRTEGFRIQIRGKIYKFPAETLIFITIIVMTLIGVAAGLIEGASTN